MIDEKRLIEKIEKMFVPLSTPDGRESIDIRINGYNECLVDVLETIKEQPKVGEWIPFNKKETKEESQKKKDYIYVALMKEKQNGFLKNRIVRKFICAISLFTAAVLFMLLLLMLKCGYGFIQVVCVLATPIVLSYVIFLLVFIGFVLIDF